MTLGVVGGMGAQATALFYEKLIALQNVETEQEYIDVLIYSKSSIPDRTAYITGKSGESPLPALLHAVKTLKTAGASCIAIPCITSHFFLDDLGNRDFGCILNMLEETARHISGTGYKKVGLLATMGTLHGRFFHDALARYNIETLEPTPADQAALMEYIYAIKKGRSVDLARLHGFSGALLSQGAEAVILGCTELSVAAKDSSHDYIDALDILAQAAITKSKK
ncbi:MAG: amino acid racemase [Defluviitaleaceae bacterium]|nr:amino acid racemase [Defluviitaleaceae bacterium]